MSIDVIRLALEAGFKASVGKTDLDGKYHPDVNALSKDVPIEWLERFAALVMEECAKACDENEKRSERISNRLAHKFDAEAIRVRKPA